MKTIAQKPRTRGQTIILGALSMLMMALMMMASYSVGNAVHQKIALQSQADAQAYSIAVTEARYLNVVAHYNRAIVGTLVAQMSLHAFMAVATGDVDQFHDSVAVMAEIVLFEVAEGCRMIAPWVPHPMAWLHCPHMLAASLNGLVLFAMLIVWDMKLQGVENSFNTAVESVDNANKRLSRLQNVIIAKASLELLGTGSVGDNLKRNAPTASNNTAVFALNEIQYACTMEGSSIDSLCVNVPSPMNPYRARQSASDRSRVIAAAANAARPLFVSGTVEGLAASGAATARYAGKFNKDGDEISGYIFSGTWDQFVPMELQPLRGHIGDSKIGNALLPASFLPPYAPSNSTNDPAKNAAAGGSGLAWVKNWFTHGHAPWNPLPFGGGILSDSGGGQHAGFYGLGGFLPNASHSKFKGNTVGISDPCGGNTCFVNYRGQTNANKDYGQPSVFSGVTQSLRVFDKKTADPKGDRELTDNTITPPWELNSKGQVDVSLIKGRTETVNYVARGEGHAVAKAKVYFHQLGDWTVPPNFFDPFWRAKLHTFESRAELDAVLALAGDANSALMLAPYEGQGF